LGDESSGLARDESLFTRTTARAKAARALSPKTAGHNTRRRAWGRVGVSSGGVMGNTPAVVNCVFSW
jgi:hypothetical protein